MQPKIFLSYCWKNSDEANIIDTDFNSIGITLRRDIRDIIYKKSIPDFINDSKYDFMIVLISDEYLRSKNCMLETLNLYNKGEFEKKILPIILPNATGIFNNEGQIIYRKYWEEEKLKAYNLLIENLDTLPLQQHQQVDEIFAKISRIFERLVSINILTLDTMRQLGYEPMLTIAGYNVNEIPTDLIKILQIKDATKRKIEFERFILNYPKNKRGLYFQASLLIQAEHYDRARVILEELIDTFPDFVEAHNDLGLILMDFFEEYHEALEHFEQALKIDPDNYQVYINQGLLYAGYPRNYEKAKQCYETAIVKNPFADSAYNNLAMLLSDHFPNIDNETILNYYKRAIEINPKFADAFSNIGAFYIEKSKDFNKAREYFKEAVKLDPRHAGYITNLAILEERTSNYDKAKTYLESAIALDASFPQAHIHLANLLKNHYKEYSRALHHYKRTLELKPNLIELYIDVADLIQEHFSDRKGEIDYLKMCYEKLIEIYEHNLAVADSIDPNLSAEEKHKTLALLDKHNSRFGVGYKLLGLLLYEEYHDFEGAKNMLLKALQHNPNDKVLRVKLMDIFKNHFKNENAEEFIEKAIQVKPSEKDLVQNESPDSNRKEKLTEAFELAAELASQGKSRKAIRRALVEKGLNEIDAVNVEDILHEQFFKGARKKINQEKNDIAYKNMVRGALWCIGGLIISYVTYNEAKTGGIYIVAYGAIIAGGIQFIIGLLQRFS